MAEQSYTYPQNVFEAEGPGEDRFWSCVMTRPRCEKKFSEWLTAKQIPHFLPVLDRETVSHRRRRTHQLPMFPGYLFVVGDRSKSEFIEARTTLAMLKPTTDLEVNRLHGELWNLWHGLCNSRQLELQKPLEKGDPMEVVAGPLKGLRGLFDRWGTGRKLVISVQMLKVSIAVELSETCVAVPLN